MTTLLSCSMLSCGTVNLYTLGIMERSGKTKAEMTTNALRAAQLQETGAGDAQLLHQHVYVNRFDPLKDDVLAEVVAEKSDLLVIVKRYAERHSMTIHNKEITGFLIDDHPYVGQNIRLSTEEVGISHLIGEVFAVYSNGMCALKIVAKIDFEGQSDKLGKQFEDHLRLLPTYYVELELDRRAKTD